MTVYLRHAKSDIEKNDTGPYNSDRHFLKTYLRFDVTNYNSKIKISFFFKYF